MCVCCLRIYFSRKVLHQRSTTQCRGVTMAQFLIYSRLRGHFGPNYHMQEIIKKNRNTRKLSANEKFIDFRVFKSFLQLCALFFFCGGREWPVADDKRRVVGAAFLHSSCWLIFFSAAPKPKQESKEEKITIFGNCFRHCLGRLPKKTQGASRNCNECFGSVRLLA